MNTSWERVFRFLVATMVFVWREFLGPIVTGLVRGAGEGLRAVARRLVPPVAVVGLLVLWYRTNPESLADSIGLVVFLGLLAWVGREWFRAAFSGRRR